MRDTPPSSLSKYSAFSICNRKILLFPAGCPPRAVVYSLYNYILYKLSAHTGCQGLQRNGALQPFALHLAPHMVGLFYVSIYE